MRIRRYRDFFSMFDERTGAYMRSNILKDGKETEEEPFMAPFPELLDVGIMGHCKHGMSGLCVKAGVECYQDGLHAFEENMSVEDFEDLARQCERKTFQFALGGRGDPDQHEHFEEILEICRSHGIVPNFTTSGLGMNERIASLCKEYCGAVAVSWYRSPYTVKAIEELTAAGVKTNIHYVLGKNTVKEALERMQGGGFTSGINAVVLEQGRTCWKRETRMQWSSSAISRMRT